MKLRYEIAGRHLSGEVAKIAEENPEFKPHEAVASWANTRIAAWASHADIDGFAITNTTATHFDIELAEDDGVKFQQQLGGREIG
jgi:hypothetical protein